MSMMNQSNNILFQCPYKCNYNISFQLNGDTISYHSNFDGSLKLSSSISADVLFKVIAKMFDNKNFIFPHFDSQKKIVWSIIEKNSTECSLHSDLKITQAALTTDFLGYIFLGNSAFDQNDLKQAEFNYGHALALIYDQDQLIMDTYKNRPLEAYCLGKVRDIYIKKAEEGSLLKDWIKAAVLENYILKAQGYSIDDVKDVSEFRHRLGGIEIKLWKKCSIKEIPNNLWNETLKLLKKFTRKREEIRSFISSNAIRYTEVQDHLIRYTEFIKKIIKDQVEFTQRYLGPIDCKYAIIGFGSLANNEMTPFSDLEFGILIEKDEGKYKDYFRELTYLIWMRVVNLGETMIRTLDIPALSEADFFDDLIPRGFAFDGEGVKGKGCKTPLGNGQSFELIQTPEKMAQYIGQCKSAEQTKTEWWFEREPHLPLELLTYTPIYVSHADANQLLEQYKNNVNSILEEKCNDVTLREYLSVNHLFEEDKFLFDTSIINPLKEGALFHLKKDSYRLPRILIDRAVLHEKIDAVSGYLNKIDRISNKIALTSVEVSNIKNALMATNYIRLSSYLNASAQKDIKASLSPREKSCDQRSVMNIHFFCNKIVDFLLKKNHYEVPPINDLKDCLEISLNEIIVNSRYQDKNKALQMIEKALQLKGENPYVLAIAGIAYQSIDLQKSKECFETALTKEKLTFHDQLNIKTSLSKTYHLLKDSKAHDLCVEIYSSYSEDSNLSRHPDFIVILCNWAVSIIESNQDIKKIEYVIGEIEKFLKDRYLQLVSTGKGQLYNNLAALYQKAYRDIKKYLENCPRPPLYNDSAFASHLHYLKTKNDALELWGKNGRQALKIKRSLYSDNHPETLSSLLTISLFFHQKEDFDKEFLYLKKAYAISKTTQDQCYSQLIKDTFDLYYDAVFRLLKTTTINEFDKLECYYLLFEICYINKQLDIAINNAKQLFNFLSKNNKIFKFNENQIKEIKEIKEMIDENRAEDLCKALETLMSINRKKHSKFFNREKFDLTNINYAVLDNLCGKDIEKLNEGF